MPRQTVSTSETASRSLLLEQERVLAKSYGTGLPRFIQRGQATTFTDVDGNTMLDLTSGMGVNLLGYSHPDVVRAVITQAQRWLHTDHAVVPHQPYLAMCAALCELAPGTKNKAALFNSGAEAVENAVKLARRFTGRSDLIVVEGGFHGRTLLTAAMSSRPIQRAGFGPLPAGIHVLPFPAPGSSAAQPDRLLEFFRTRVSADQVAAVVLEPVQGDGGVRASDREFNIELSRIAQAHGILIIADEIQTGLRTGAALASAARGLGADLWCMGKAIGGGIPLSAVIGRAEIMDSAPAGSIGGTCNGNALACAAGLSTLDVVARDNLHARAEQIGTATTAFWQAVDEPSVVETRVYGAMTAIQLPDGDLTSRVRSRALQDGVVTVTAGRDRDAVRLLPPLCVTDNELQRGLEIIHAAITHESKSGPGRD